MRTFKPTLLEWGRILAVLSLIPAFLFMLSIVGLWEFHGWMWALPVLIPIGFVLGLAILALGLFILFIPVAVLMELTQQIDKDKKTEGLWSVIVIGAAAIVTFFAFSIDWLAPVAIALDLWALFRAESLWKNFKHK